MALCLGIEIISLNFQKQLKCANNVSYWVACCLHALSGRVTCLGVGGEMICKATAAIPSKEVKKPKLVITLYFVCL